MFRYESFAQNPGYDICFIGLGSAPVNISRDLVEKDDGSKFLDDIHALTEVFIIFNFWL